MELRINPNVIGSKTEFNKFTGAAVFMIARSKEGRMLINPTPEEFEDFYGNKPDEKSSLTKEKVKIAVGFIPTDREEEYLFSNVNGFELEKGISANKHKVEYDNVNEIELDKVSVRILLESKDPVEWVEKGARKKEKIKMTAYFSWYRGIGLGFMSGESNHQQAEMLQPGMRFFNSATETFYVKTEDMIHKDDYKKPVIIDPSKHLTDTGKTSYIEGGTWAVPLSSDEENGFEKFIQFIKSVVRIGAIKEDTNEKTGKKEKPVILPKMLIDALLIEDEKTMNSVLNRYFEALETLIKESVKLKGYSEELGQAAVFAAVGLRISKDTYANQIPFEFAIPTSGNGWVDNVIDIRRILTRQEKDKMPKDLISRKIYVHGNEVKLGLVLTSELEAIDFMKNAKNNAPVSGQGGYNRPQSGNTSASSAGIPIPVPGSFDV